MAFDGTLAKDPFGGFAVHNGLWRKSAGTGMAVIRDDFHSTGTVMVEQGTLYFANGYTQTGGGIPKVELGGTISGTQ